MAYENGYIQNCSLSQVRSDCRASICNSVPLHRYCSFVMFKQKLFSYAANFQTSTNTKRLSRLVSVANIDYNITVLRVLLVRISLCSSQEIEKRRASRLAKREVLKHNFGALEHFALWLGQNIPYYLVSGRSVLITQHSLL